MRCFDQHSRRKRVLHRAKKLKITDFLESAAWSDANSGFSDCDVKQSQRQLLDNGKTRMRGGFKCTLRSRKGESLLNDRWQLHEESSLSNNSFSGGCIESTPTSKNISLALDICDILPPPNLQFGRGLLSNKVKMFHQFILI